MAAKLLIAVPFQCLNMPPMIPSHKPRLPARRSQPKRLEIQASGNTFGSYFRVTIFGESHDGSVGCVIDGCPPRVPLSEADIQVDLDRRRPGQSRTTSPRKETDTCKITSGVADGLTTGAPIMIEVPNTEQSSTDETSGRVAAGVLPKKILKLYAGTEILAYVSQVHKVVLPEDLVDYDTVTLDQIESNIVRCPSSEYAEKMIAAIDAVRVRGDSIGGVVTCLVRNVPRGLGSPVFDKLEAELNKAVFSLPGATAFDFGSGFSGTFLTGHEHNDEFYIDDSGRIRTKTNRSGGIQGGISNGEIIYMRIAFKPAASISLPGFPALAPAPERRQNTASKDKHEMELIAQGCNDPCVFPQLVPAVEAMVALVMVDQLIAQHAQCMLFPINPELQEPL